MARMSQLLVNAWPWYLDVVDTGEVGLVCERCGDAAVTYEAGIDTGTRFCWPELDIKIGLHISGCPQRPHVPDQHEQPRLTAE